MVLMAERFYEFALTDFSKLAEGISGKRKLSEANYLTKAKPADTPAKA